jgi:predicted nucleotide-binding protein (sugar kinase/HSP70/actin superfamily)
MTETSTEGPRFQHFRRPTEPPFRRAERDRVTLLIGGLSERHNRLLCAALEGLGYQVDRIPTPQKADFQTGRECGNNGQCNPAYFTVGALINYLKRLRDDEGLATEEILSSYVYVTAGSCGPCRFGMYEAEYRLALANAGFDGFRVLLFEQGRSLSQEGGGRGLELSTDFFLSVLNGILIGDLLNELECQIRPYAVDPDHAGEVFEACSAICQEALRSKDHRRIRVGWLAKLLSRIARGEDPSNLARLLEQLRSTHYTTALAQCRRLIDEGIQVDYTRPKPLVKITGEIWAQTTEGDGNFHMFRFLEEEGAEVLLEPVSAWLHYLVARGQMLLADRHGFVGERELPGSWDLRRRFELATSFWRQWLVLTLAEKLLLREYGRLRKALGGTALELPDQRELERAAERFYSARLSGGEGHLEVAKNIYYCSRDLCHMVLSLKPFGCMPSTQSDGAQAAVVSCFPEMIFLPVETSGEGEINARSRVQMALGEAKAKVRAELGACLDRSGRTLEEIRAYVARSPELRRPLRKIRSARGVVGRAARFVLDVGGRMDREPISEPGS